MPKPVATGVHAAELAAEFRLTGHFPLRLDETIAPVAIVADVSAEASTRPCVGLQEVTPPAGFVTEMIIIAPGFANPQFEAHLERIEIQAIAPLTGGSIFIRLVDPPSALSGFVDGIFGPDGNGSRFFRERRFEGRPRLLIGARSDGISSTVGNDPHAWVPGDGQRYVMDLDWILRNRPGQSTVFINPDEPNVRFRVSLWWQESDVEVRDR